MKKDKIKGCFRAGVTLLELVLAVALVAVIFAAVLPQFRIMGASWDSKRGSAEALQNGRVLMEHFRQNLGKAVRVTAVSDSSDTDGYIEFEDNDGNTMRYDISDGGHVEYGPDSGLSDLAGPVSSLRFYCYDACDLDYALSPVSDTNAIRYVRMEAVVVNSAELGGDKSVSACAYLRTNGAGGDGTSWATTYEFAGRVQGTDIFAYDGQDNQKVPASSIEPADTLSTGEYDAIEADDGVYHAYTVPSNSKYGQMRFVIGIDEDATEVGRITATFNGRGVNSKSSNTDGVSLYIWNQLSGYELLVASADTEAEVTLTGSVVGSMVNYISGAANDEITLLAASNDKKPNDGICTVEADYVEVTLTGGSDLRP